MELYPGLLWHIYYNVSFDNPTSFVYFPDGSEECVPSCLRLQRYLEKFGESEFYQRYAYVRMYVKHRDLEFLL